MEKLSCLLQTVRSSCLEVEMPSPVGSTEIRMRREGGREGERIDGRAEIMTGATMALAIVAGLGTTGVDERKRERERVREK